MVLQSPGFGKREEGGFFKFKVGVKGLKVKPYGCGLRHRVQGLGVKVWGFGVQGVGVMVTLNPKSLNP